MALKTGKKSLFTLKLFISVTVIYILFSRSNLNLIASSLRGINSVFFLAAIILNFITIYFSTLRWRLLIKSEISLKRVFSLYMTGCFFNTLLPGAMSGDAVKVYYLYKGTDKGDLAVGSVFMDRFTGFVMLMTIALFASLYNSDRLKGTGIDWLLPLAVIVFFTTLYVVFRFRIFGHVKKIKSFYDYFHGYIKEKRIIVIALFYSIMVQILSMASVYMISLGLHSSITFGDIVVFLPIVVTLTTIPLSLSGIGVREGAFVFLFGLIGIGKEEALTVSLAWFLSVALTSFFGLFFYLRYKAEIPEEETRGNFFEIP